MGRDTNTVDFAGRNCQRFSYTWSLPARLTYIVSQRRRQTKGGYCWGPILIERYIGLCRTQRLSLVVGGDYSPRQLGENCADRIA
jgi:hypothetical protein